MHLSHFHLFNCSHLENPKVLIAWWSGIGMASSFSERIIHVLKSLLNHSENSSNWGYITIMPFCLSIKDGQSQASFNNSTIKGVVLQILS